MGLYACPGDQLAIHIDGTRQLHIVLMQRTHVRIVAQEHVAVAHLLARLGIDVADQGAHDGRLVSHLKAHGGKGPIGQIDAREKIRGFGHGG